MKSESDEDNEFIKDEKGEKMKALINIMSKRLPVLLFISGLAFADPMESLNDPRMEWGHCTQRDNAIYLFVNNWPASGEIDLPLIKNKVKRISFLVAEKGANLEHTRAVDNRGNQVIKMMVPKVAPMENIVVIKAELEGKAALDPVKHFYDPEEKRIVLEAKDFHAITGAKTKIYYDRDMGAVHQFFAKGGDAPVWSFEVPESREYAVTVVYSAHRNLARN